MLTYALILFAIAAVGGLVLASFVLRQKLAPWALSLLHAGLGAAGLVCLAIGVLDGAPSRAGWALLILVVAALGGFYLAILHLQNRNARAGLVAIHAGAAVTGVLLVASVAFGLF